MWFLAVFSVVLSGVLFGLSAFPGILEQVPDDLARGAAAIYALIALALVARHLLRPSHSNRKRRPMSALIVLIMLVVTPLLLLNHVPRRLLFTQYQSELETLLPHAPPGSEYAVAPLNADLGLVWIDQWGTDRRGGVYFRTLWIKSQSFGYVHRPNTEGSPFGDREYELQHLTGDWYSFAASDGH